MRFCIIFITDLVATDIQGDVMCGGYVDGWNITELNDRAMFVDKNQTILGLKVFISIILIYFE